MAQLRQLTPREVLFVGGENSRVYQHTAGLTLLDASMTPGFCYEFFRQHLEQRLSSIPHFRWKLHEVALGLDLPYWVEDENFSFDHHIRRIAVPAPGDEKALAEVVSYLYCRHLDRNRPLWETWFIEGLADGQYALVQKLHHCMMDGEGASKLSAAMCDLEPDAAPREVPPAIAEARPGPVPEPWRENLNTALHLSRLPMNIGRELADAVRKGASSLLRSEKRVGKPATPMAVFNGNIGRSRGFVFGSLRLAEVKAIKNHFGVTLNDVVLALVGGALRTYLLSRDALPAQSLRTSMPVSMRTDEDEEFSNRVTDVNVTLATHLADPVQRLRAIAGESASVKQEARAGGKGLMDIVQIMPPGLVSVMLNFMPVEQIAKAMGINLVVSNVRGVSQPMYIGGARMTAMYPMSIIFPGSGINVTCISYADNFHFGITIDPELVPNPWLLIDALHDGLKDYLSLTQKKGTTGRKKAPVRRATVKPAGGRARRGSARRSAGRPGDRTSTRS